MTLCWPLLQCPSFSLFENSTLARMFKHFKVMWRFLAIKFAFANLEHMGKQLCRGKLTAQFTCNSWRLGWQRLPLSMMNTIGKDPKQLKEHMVRPVPCFAVGTAQWRPGQQMNLMKPLRPDTLVSAFELPNAFKMQIKATLCLPGLENEQ